MSVHTEISKNDLAPILSNFSLGQLVKLSGIKEGVTNTIYYLETTQGAFILTVFEQLSEKELPFYIELMNFLADKSIPCPKIVKNKQDENIFTLKEKPAIISHYLPGNIQSELTATQCYELGIHLAQLHCAGKNFPHHQKNSRDTQWCEKTAESLWEKLSSQKAKLLKEELTFQKSHDVKTLPQGIIHADLFPDNILFNEGKITGLIDFYYACSDALLLDLAICITACCFNEKQILIDENYQYLLRAYQTVRPLTSEEKDFFPLLLRRAALRFWLSRLYDFYYCPRNNLVQIKDPKVYENILKAVCETSFF